ncbi:reverse transcriptase-like protein [Candidatus Mycosynbacter amalyticus]|uniref:Reverse transcriptase-like protein n=1 Tax=Candidatus Mycosynbacter amalyticus TaxID=2665156 RepID=A0A857MLG6_9BACT|nr:reverse transcriptase-like protein [Candidatus Mycosynbacter amalyticus]QHN42452.1 reverse transcriptase-like protein [Candidatus Mycosynbacter amalyticus]
MKQRTAVRALVRKHDQTLLLRRANGRESILGKFELPGGKIDYHEQPEDALRRYLAKDAGLVPLSMQLFDVITYIDSDDPELQYVFIVYLVNVEDARVTLSDNYDKAIWQSKSKIQHREITESSQVLLGLSEQKIVTDESGEHQLQIDENIATEDRMILYSDGGSRGNPGISAAAYVVESATGDVIEKGGQFLGITTSYQAEYHGLLLGLERALELGYKRLEYRLDSLMVVNQMKGIYTVKNRELWPINERVIDLLTQFEDVRFVHVRREFNTLADAEVNRILDMHAKPSGHSEENTVY